MCFSRHSPNIINVPRLEEASNSNVDFDISQLNRTMKKM